MNVLNAELLESPVYWNTTIYTAHYWCAIWKGKSGKIVHKSVHFWNFVLQKGAFLAKKVPYKRVLFSWKSTAYFGNSKFHVLFAYFYSNLPYKRAEFSALTGLVIGWSFKTRDSTPVYTCKNQRRTPPPPGHNTLSIGDCTHCFSCTELYCHGLTFVETPYFTVSFLKSKCCCCFPLWLSTQRITLTAFGLFL